MMWGHPMDLAMHLNSRCSETMLSEFPPGTCRRNAAAALGIGAQGYPQLSDHQQDVARPLRIERCHSQILGTQVRMTVPEGTLIRVILEHVSHFLREERKDVNLVWDNLGHSNKNKLGSKTYLRSTLIHGFSITIQTVCMVVQFWLPENESCRT